MADLIIINSKIWTADPAQPFAEAMAVEGDKIVAVGSTKEILKYKKDETKVLDKPGELILPGFIDSHLHFLDGGFSLSSVQLKDAQSKEEFISRVKSFAKDMNSGEWMLLGYWDHENWGGEMPNCEWIDEFTKDIPVFLRRCDGHMALANTAAMNAAGLTEAVKEPVGGEIGRFDNGHPSGIFKDNAMPLISSHIPEFSMEQSLKAMTAASEYVASHGLTSVHHMGTLSDYHVFKTALEAKQMQTRIYATAPLSQFETILEKQKELGLENPMLKLNGAKIFADGSLGSKTAAFFDPYLDEPDESGLLMDDPENWRKGILAADKAGLQVVVHAIGDKANNIILNFYEECIAKNGEKDRRLRIEHVQHLHPNDIMRFEELGVIASMQPWHLMDDGRWAERTIGKERAKTAYCLRSLLDNGAILAFGSDWFVAPPVPLLGIYAAVTRLVLDGSKPDGWVPEEKITLEEALIGYTLNGAYTSFDEDIKGSLEVGKLADFIVLDNDLFTIDPEQIIDVNVLYTYLGGAEISRK